MDSPILKLIIEAGPREGEVLEFNPKTRPSIQVGRVVRGNTVPIKEDGISSKHLSICFTAGKWAVTDLDSSNGTKLNSTSLEPLTCYDLKDADVIKIGECTSIRVQFVFDISDAQLRRSTRRGCVPSYPQEKGLGVAAGAGRGVIKRGAKGSIVQNVAMGARSEAETSTLGHEAGQENVQEVLVEKEEKRPVRGRPKKACNPKDGNSDDSSVPVSSDAFPAVSENAEDLRSRPRTRKKDVTSLQKDGVEKEDEVAPPQRRLRSRNKKDNTNIMLSSELEKVKEVETTETEKQAEKEESIQVQKRETRARGRRKKNEQEAPPDTAIITSQGEKDGTQEINKSDELCKDLVGGLDEKVDQEVSQLQLDEGKLNKNNEDLGKPRDPDSKTGGLASQELEGGLDGELGGSTSQGTGSNSDHREKDNKACESPDLSEMTLGEWFDYLERDLPKQIKAETDLIIEDMRKRSRQIHEFMLQQQKEQGII